MRILSFGNSPLDPRFGSGKTRLAWSQGLRALGHDVETRDPASLLTPWSRRLGFRLGLAWAARRAMARADLARVDVVEFCGAEFWWATRWLAGRRRRPMILAHTDGLELLASERLAAAGRASRGQLERWLPGLDLERRSRQAFTRADRFAALCQLDVKYVVDRGLFAPAHAALASPGLDAIFLGRPWQPEREDVLVFFGSSSARKGVHHLGAVAGRFLADHPAWRLLVLGAPGQAEQFRSGFDPAVWPRVEVAPKLAVGEVVARLERAKVLYSPSEYEGFGLAVAEAMACGCAAVVTPTGFGAELADGTEALGCAFGDRAAMLRALATLADDEAVRRRIAQAGWARVQSLSWPDSVRRFERTLAGWLNDWRKETADERSGRQR